MSPGLQLQADIRIAAGTGLVWARPELEVDVFFMNLNNLSLITLVTISHWTTSVGITDW